MRRAGQAVAVLVILASSQGAPARPGKKKRREQVSKPVLDTPPGTVDVDVTYGGTVSFDRSSGAYKFSAALIVQPIVGYFLTERFEVAGGLRYTALFDFDGPDTHTILPFAGVRWLFRPKKAWRPFVGIDGSVGVRFKGGARSLVLGGALSVGVLTAITSKAAAQFGLTLIALWYAEPGELSVSVPFGNIGLSFFY